MHSNSDIRKLESPIPPARLSPPAYEEGVNIDELPVGAMLEVETGHTTYLLENRRDGKVLISGHPEYCPEPIEVEFQGSIGGTALLKIWRIEPGMKMAFRHPKFGMVRTLLFPARKYRRSTRIPSFTAKFSKSCTVRK